MEYKEYFDARENTWNSTSATAVAEMKFNVSWQE